MKLNQRLTKKQLKFILLIVLILIAAGVSALAWQINSNATTESSPTPQIETYRPKSREINVSPEENQPVETTDIPDSPNITIDNVSAGAKIEAGDMVEGKVISPEGTLYISIKGAITGKIADYSITVISSDSEPQAYSFEIVFEKQPQSGEKGILDVYTKENGVRAYSKQVEVTF